MVISSGVMIPYLTLDNSVEYFRTRILDNKELKYLGPKSIPAKKFVYGKIKNDYVKIINNFKSNENWEIYWKNNTDYNSNRKA